MSKSLHNSLTIRDALKKYNYEVLKYVFFQKHYTSDIDLLDDDYRVAEKHLYYFYETIAKAQEIIDSYADNTNYLDDFSPDEIRNKFIEAMDDDFNTPIVISELHSIFKYINSKLQEINKSNRVQTANTFVKIISDLKELYGIIGLFTQVPDEFMNM